MKKSVSLRLYYILLIIFSFTGKIYCQIDYENLSINNRLKYDLTKTLLMINEKYLVLVNKNVSVRNEELVSINYATYPYRIIHQQDFRPWDIEFNFEKKKIKFIWNMNSSKIIGVSALAFDCSVLYNKNGTISRIVEGTQKTYEKGPYTYLRKSYNICYDRNLNITSITEQTTKYKTDSLGLFIDSVNYKTFEKFYEYDKLNHLTKFEYLVYSFNLENPITTWHEMDSIVYSVDTMKLYQKEVTENNDFLYTFIYKKNNITDIRFNDLKHSYNDWIEHIEINSLGFVSKYSRISLYNNERSDLIINYTFRTDWNQYQTSGSRKFFKSNGECYLERKYPERMERKFINGEWTEWKNY